MVANTSSSSLDVSLISHSVSSADKKTIEALVNSSLVKALRPDGKGGNFEIKLEGGKVSFRWAGTSNSLEILDPEQTKALFDIIQTYDTIYKEAKANYPQAPSAAKKISKEEVVGVSSDVLSLTANTLGAVSTVVKTTRVALPFLGILRGPLQMVSGVFLMKSSAKQGRVAYERGDQEGLALSGSSFLLGGTQLGLGGGMTTTSVATVAATSTAKVIVAKVSPALTPLALALYGVLLFTSLYEMAANLIFQAKLSKDQDPLQTLSYIRDQVGSSTDEKELRKKWDRFARQTSVECCKKARDLLGQDLVEFSKTSAAQQLIDEIKVASGRKLVKHSILLLIAVLGIAAIAAGMILSGPAAPVLFLVGALLWLLVDSKSLHLKAGKAFYPDAIPTNSSSESSSPTAPLLPEHQPSPSSPQ